MSRQDKATTERNAKALRELLKKTDNKVCADCKRNDPRWASWNLGLFLCIRCSGIHRSMGTHISKVKSVDLDAWTPAQMEGVKKWGNRLANKYWEAHLKAGHIPPDHKMDSFIRSKYETRRWALDGPPPDDPTVLDTDSPQAPAQQAIQQQQPIATPPVQNNSPPTTAPRHQLLSVAHQQQPQPQRAQLPSTQQQPKVPVAQVPTSPQTDLFSLDFHSPTPPASTAPAGQSATAPRNPKQDIMSLFSSTPPPQPQAQTLWSQPQPPQAQPQSMMGTNGTGMWGVSSGWQPQPQPQPQPQSQGVWGDFTGGGAAGSITTGTNTGQHSLTHMQFGGQPQVQMSAQPQQLFGTNDIWASSAPVTSASSSTGGQKDAFDDIWGGFK